MSIIGLGHSAQGGLPATATRAVSAGDRRGRHRAANSLRLVSSRPRLVMVRFPSARKSRASTTEATVMSASIVGVATPMRRARSVRNTNE